MIGETLGSYTIIGRLGAGGMGEVYLAEHPRIERRAAIKVLLPELSGNREVVERFFAEARATSSIRHHGIVEVLDCDVHRGSGRAYIVMELLEGESLAGRLERDSDFGKDVDRALTVTGAIADAVAAAHAKGIVHRDLKPDNVFLAGNESAPLGFDVKILDFGIAKLMGDASTGRGGSMRTRTGSMLGTPAYMSPEQCRGAGLVDHRSDIYSLGCIAFEMLAGRRPFMHEGFGELIAAHLGEPPPTFASLGVDIAPDVEQWVRRLLAKSRDERLASMADVSASIRALRHRTTAVLPSSLADVTASAPSGSSRPPSLSSSPGGTTAMPSVGATVALPPPRQAAPFVTTTTTLSAHASENVRRGPQPIGKWAAGAVAALALVGGALYLGRSKPSPSLSPPATPAAVEPARQPEPVTFDVSDAPEGLQVSVDGAPAALPIRLPAGNQTHELVFRAPGFRDRTLRVDASVSRTLTLSLQPAAPEAPAGATAPQPPAPGDRGDARKKRPRHPSSLSDDARKL
ncbi:MAG: eukaryotic-like serine/threonine-protein kinase [Myxococcales bacterium]|jgi:serine/threonine-protein kinase|nr:eukaryotic-like serine/threonine-protein kinase [Myxococcales bacterium]